MIYIYQACTEIYKVQSYVAQLKTYWKSDGLISLKQIVSTLYQSSQKEKVFKNCSRSFEPIKENIYNKRKKRHKVLNNNSSTKKT